MAKSAGKTRQKDRSPRPVVSERPRAQASVLFKKLKIPSEIPILTGDDVEKAKPSPDVFVAVAEQLNVAIGDCIVVGDSVWDLLAAGRKSALGVGLLSRGYG
jgi:HAD superfamily hydrolase (TIGR01549 family)